MLINIEDVVVSINVMYYCVKVRGICDINLYMKMFVFGGCFFIDNELK